MTDKIKLENEDIIVYSTSSGFMGYNKTTKIWTEGTHSLVLDVIEELCGPQDY